MTICADLTANSACCSYQTLSQLSHRIVYTKSSCAYAAQHTQLRVAICPAPAPWAAATVARYRTLVTATPQPPQLSCTTSSGSAHILFRNSYVVTIHVPHIALLAILGTTPLSRPRGPSSTRSSRSTPLHRGTTPSTASATCKTDKQTDEFTL